MAQQRDARRLPLRALLTELGALALIWGGEWFHVEAYAVPACCALIGASAFSRWRNSVPFDRLWLALNGTALGFGIMDMMLRAQLSPDIFAALCATLLAALFLLGSSWRVPMIQLLAEQRTGQLLDRGNPTLSRFFRLYTLIWAGYFSLRALTLLLMSLQPQDMLAEQIGLKLSLLIMILLSFRGPALYRLYQRAHPAL